MLSTEIEKFSRLAANWWQPTGEMAPLHRINPLRVLFLDTSVPLVGKRVLDVGCGGGLFAESIAELGARVTAIDPSAELIAVAKQHLAQHARKLDLVYQVATAAQTKEAESYDIVTCLEVLEHTDDPAELVSQCVRLLKPGGWAYFSTINRTPAAFVQAIVLAEYVLRWLPRRTHAYRHLVKPAELASYLAAHRMEMKDMKGITYDPLRRAFYLSARVDVNYLLLARKAAAS